MPDEGILCKMGKVEKGEGEHDFFLFLMLDRCHLLFVLTRFAHFQELGGSRSKETETMSDATGDELEVDGVEQALRSLHEKLPPFRPPSPLRHPQLRPLPPAVRTLGPRSMPRPQYHLVSTCASSSSPSTARIADSSVDESASTPAAAEKQQQLLLEVTDEFFGIEELGRTTIEATELADRTRIVVCDLQEEAHLEVRALPDDEDVDRERIIRLEEREFMCAARHIQSKISLLRIAQTQKFMKLSREFDAEATAGVEELIREEHRAWVDHLYYFRTHRPELSASDGTTTGANGGAGGPSALRFHDSPQRAGRGAVSSEDITPQKIIANNHVYWEVQGQYDWELQKQHVWNWWKQGNVRVELVGAEDQGRLDIVAQEIRGFMVLDEVFLEQQFRIRRAEKEFTGKLEHVPAPPPATGRHLAEAIKEAERLVTEVLNSDARPSSATSHPHPSPTPPAVSTSFSGEVAKHDTPTANTASFPRQSSITRSGSTSTPAVTLSPEAEEAVRHSDHKALELVLQIGQAVRASNEAYSKGVPLLTGLLPLEVATRALAAATEATATTEQDQAPQNDSSNTHEVNREKASESHTESAAEAAQESSSDPAVDNTAAAPPQVIETRIPLLFLQAEEEKVLMTRDRHEPGTHFSNLNILLDTVLDGPEPVSHSAAWLPLLSSIDEHIVASLGHEELELALVLSSVTFGKEFLRILWNTRRHHPDVGNAIELVPCRWTQYQTVADIEAEELLEMTFAEMLQREDVVNEQVTEVYGLWLMRKRLLEQLWAAQQQQQQQQEQ